MDRTTKRLLVWAGVVIALLMIPFVLRAPWTSGDFIFAAVVLYGCATVYELTTKDMAKSIQKVMTGVVVLGVLILIWGWAVA